MSIVSRTKTYAVCPSCGEDAGCIDRLIGTTTETLWYCDACGQRYRLEFTANGNVEITSTTDRKVTTVDVLVLPPQAHPVYFVVKGMRFEGRDKGAFDESESKQFYYEEHSCPVNWLHPEMVYCDGDSDPHGLIQYVAHVDESSLPKDESFGPNDYDAALIELIAAADKQKR